MDDKSPQFTRLIQQAERILGPIISPRQPLVDVEISLLQLGTDEDIMFALHWIEVIAVSNIELAFSFAVHIGKAREKLSEKGVRAWLHESLFVYDREGLYPAMQVLRDITGFKKNYTRREYVCELKDVKPRLDIYIRGLAGRALALKPGTEIYTDTEHLYLPDSISRYTDKRKNETLYKAMACFLWAQTWYGTFKRGAYSSETTQEKLDAYADPDTARRLFVSLENIRLLACIERDLPGLYREMSAISPLLVPADRTWKAVSRKLRQSNASVETSFIALETLMHLKLNLPETDYQGNLNLQEVEFQITNRKNQALLDISELLNNHVIDESELEQAIADASKALSSDEDPGQAEPTETGGDSDELNEANNRPADSRLSEIIQALLQDVEHFDEGLFGDLPGSLREDACEDMTNSAPIKQNSNGELLDNIVELDEWDYLRQSYRKRWCRVSIRQVEELHDGFKQKTEKKYPFLSMQIRKVFEAMRDQPRYANRQTDGDEVDLDAVVDMYTAKLAGEELSERVYIRRQQNERSVSVCLLVDMSGSTKGWINLAMRESLVLVSEALNTLGDQYSILGFSGLTRQRCEIYEIKEFSDHFGILETSNRISNIQAKDYTRMGFAVRYATQRLLEADARHRILLMLSDGKPDDYDGYQGEYGIQDTRKAILEAQGHSINPYSITIDKQAQVYLPRLFGPGQYMILNDVSTLPLKLSEVYRNIST